MGFDLLSAVVTAISFACFIGIMVWAYSKSAAKGFEEAELLPFQEDEQPGGTISNSRPQGFQS
jgi:cytochrome c oxidase cbb3-type subunit IV